MHSYSINTDIRQKVVYILVIISTIISILLTHSFADSVAQLNNIINQSRDIQYIVKIISGFELIPNVFGIPLIYNILYRFFDNHAWKCKFVKRILNVADLNGKWDGTLISSHNGGKIIDMSLDITQTWTKIKCTANFNDSSSNSSIAAIYSDDCDNCTLYFAFVNNSRDIKTEMQMYDGFNILTLNGDKLNGRYFNNRPNHQSNYVGGNIGTIELIRDKTN